MKKDVLIILGVSALLILGVVLYRIYIGDFENKMALAKTEVVKIANHINKYCQVEQMSIQLGTSICKDGETIKDNISSITNLSVVDEILVLEYDGEKVTVLQVMYNDKKIIYTHGNKVSVEN